MAKDTEITGYMAYVGKRTPPRLPHDCRLCRGGGGGGRATRMPAFGEGRIRDYSNSENKPNRCTVVETISLENLV